MLREHELAENCFISEVIWMAKVPRIIKLISLIVLSMFVGWIAVAQQPKRVDDAVLRDAGKTGDEWITYNMNWSEQRYSPLNQINASNVSKIGVGWSYEIPAASG